MDDRPIKVLLIEDNPGDARLIQEMLTETRSAQFDLECAEQLSSGLERLDKGGVDIALLDLSLPDSHGFDTFSRAQERAPQVPVIVLTGFEDETLAVRSVREGAQDYLVKGSVDGPLLVHAILYAIERKQVAGAEVELERAHAQLLPATAPIAGAMRWSRAGSRLTPSPSVNNPVGSMRSVP